MTPEPAQIYILTPLTPDFRQIRAQLEDYARLMGLEPAQNVGQAAANGGRLWIVQHDNGNETVEMVAARSYYHARLRPGAVPHIEAATTEGWRMEIALAGKVLARKAEKEMPVFAGDMIHKAAFIPGLLQPGSAVYVDGRPGRVFGLPMLECTRFVLVVHELTVLAIGMDTSMANEISLSLTDVTSCAHAAWWVGEGLRGFSPEELRVLGLCLRGCRLNLDQQRTLQELVMRKAAERAARTAEVGP